MRRIFVAAAILAGTTVSANASTLGFDDFIIMGGQIQNGNCPFDDSPCILLNPGETVMISLAGDAEFDLTSFAYTMQGQATMEATSDTGGLFTDPNGGGNSGDLLADLSLLDDFMDITKVTFDNSADRGSMRIGSFLGMGPDVAPVPLPAAGLMLLTALGGAAALRRKG